MTILLMWKQCLQMLFRLLSLVLERKNSKSRECLLLLFSKYGQFSSNFHNSFVALWLWLWYIIICRSKVYIFIMSVIQFLSYIAGTRINSNAIIFCFPFVWELQSLRLLVLSCQQKHNILSTRSKSQMWMVKSYSVLCLIYLIPKVYKFDLF